MMEMLAISFVLVKLLPASTIDLGVLLLITRGFTGDMLSFFKEVRFDWVGKAILLLERVPVKSMMSVRAVTVAAGIWI
jgi:hypothetical protein